MRDVIYLSTAKLRQLSVSGSGRLAGVSGELKLPLLGAGFKVEKEPVGARSSVKPDKAIELAVRALGSGQFPPKWYEDPTVGPGDWVQFDTRLSYFVVDGASALAGSPLVLFIDPHLLTGGRDGKARLLLHGSPGHLVSGGEQVVKASDDEFFGGSFPGAVAALFRAMSEDDGEPAGSEPAEYLEKLLDEGLRSWVHRLSLSPVVLAASAAQLAGLARVTVVLKRTVLASPLFVQFEPAGKPAEE